MQSVRVVGVVTAALLAFAGCGTQEPDDQDTGSQQQQQQSDSARSDGAQPDDDRSSEDRSGSTGDQGAEDDGERADGDDGNAEDSPTDVPDELRFEAETVAGDQLAGADLLGEPTVLWFWAPWCPVCQREADGVGKVAHANKDVTFVGVAAQDEKPAMKEFVNTYDVGGFDHIADLDASVWGRFGVEYQPAFAFIDADGTIDVHPGTLSEADLERRIDDLERSRDR